MNSSYAYVELQNDYNIECSSKLYDTFYIKSRIYYFEHMIPTIENYHIYKDELSDYDEIEEYMKSICETLPNLIDILKNTLIEILNDNDETYCTKFDKELLKCEVCMNGPLDQYKVITGKCNMHLFENMEDSFDDMENSNYREYANYVRDVNNLVYGGIESIYVKTELYTSPDFDLEDYIMNKYTSYNTDILNYVSLENLERLEGCELCKYITMEELEEREEEKKRIAKEKKRMIKAIAKVVTQSVIEKLSCNNLHLDYTKLC